jgi:hypothetical protein
MTGAHDQTDIDTLLVRSIARWAIVVSIMLFAFDLAILAGWPFPIDSGAIRGAFYSILGVALLGAAAFITFVGYRVVTLRVARESRAVYLLFLPAVVVLTSIVGFLLFTGPR